MSRKLYRWIDGKFVEIYNSETPELAPYVQDDTMAPLKHPVTGKIIESRAEYLRVTKSLGLEIVGNDLLSKRARRANPEIPESAVMDAIQRAESVFSDSAKLRAYRNMQMELAEKRERMLNGRNR